MTYTELTCDDIELSLEDLYEGGLRKMPDGSFSQQVVIVE